VNQQVDVVDVTKLVLAVHKVFVDQGFEVIVFEEVKRGVDVVA